jgi:hypothetical protein
MNPSTLVTVHGYAGDSKQVTNALPFYLHHGCPVLVLSPVDSPIVPKNRPAAQKVQFQTGGRRAYTGQLSLDRQIEHMKIMLSKPFEFFLANDSDSVCIDPKIPDYLYAEPDVLWSNIVADTMHDRSDDPDYKYPRLAFQPPYFMSRNVIEKLLMVADKVKANPRTPFIDWCMMAWAFDAEIEGKNFRDGVSCPTANYGPGQIAMLDGVENRGATMLHSIKTPDVLYKMAGGHVSWNRKNRAKNERLGNRPRR